MKNISLTYDVVIIGGGISGICAAISAARNGVEVALVQNRPVLGGNASSEIRMHICGAAQHGGRENARETGIVEELLLENKYRNPQASYSIFDTILWEKVHFEDNITLYLNTHVTDVCVENGQIKQVMGYQLTTEKVITFEGRLFVDTTGDAMIADLAGAELMYGQEGKADFGETFAVDVADNCTMGNTLLFTTKDMGKPIPFVKPSWANTYCEDDLAYRNHGAYGYNYWWVELGGDELHTIEDGEILRDELLKAVYGIWDHIKNDGDHGADNYVLDWIGFLPGKRESRRVVGDYILKEQDLAQSVYFEDAVAYGGWTMDVHIIGGLKAKDFEPTNFIKVPELYNIPYRSLYSKDIKNLFIGGRAISATHMAFSSTRVMATCGVIGEAIGVAASYAVKNNQLPSDVTKNIQTIQQELLKQDAYIVGIKNEDENDLARTCFVRASSEKEGYEAENIIDGISRTVKDNMHCWHSKAFNNSCEWVLLTLQKAKAVKRIDIKFDSNLSKPIMLTHFTNGKEGQEQGTPSTLVKDFDVELYAGDELVEKEEIRGNYLRFNSLIFNNIREITSVKIKVHSTHGTDEARIFEVRIY